MAPTRRVLVAAAAAGWVAATLDGCAPADRHRREGSFASVAMRRDVGWVVVRPSDGSPDARLPVLVVLHGMGGSASSVDDLGARDALSTTGARLAIVGVDGGSQSYWHARRDGTDAGRMVTDELLPRLGAAGLDVARPALYGFSMGGYGALLLGATRLRGRVSSIATASAALWRRAADTAPGAFDDAEDYDRHDVFSRRPLLARVPLRMDCGGGDPFLAANQAFRSGCTPAPAGAVQPGRGHDMGYWRDVFPDAVRHAAAHLA